MAHGITGTTIRVHQALHGYSDGHRLLACSATLKARDQKTMLVMSDVSGPNAVINDSGYLTGYPLAEGGVYALGCTWAATEMARPGCVWTHTLLIDFADLAVLSSMDFLIESFERPKSRIGWNAYNTALEIDCSRNNEKRQISRNRELLARLLAALYKHPKERIIASSEENAIQSIFLAWAQQWPRLRRSFRFCSLSFGDRSADGSAFDLQLVPLRERSVRSRFSGTIDADRLRPESETWLSVALDDILQGDAGSLRRFLREVGGDLTVGREAFVPLCRLHQLIPQFSTEDNAIDEAANLLSTCFEEADANALRTKFVANLMGRPETIGRRPLRFLLRHLDLLAGPDLAKGAAALGTALWSQEPASLVALLHDVPPRSIIAECALAAMSAETLVMGLEHNPQVIPEVLERRPDLVESPELWSIPGSWSSVGLRISSHGSDPSLVIAAMLRAPRGDLASEAVMTFGSPLVLRIIFDLASREGMEAYSDIMPAWLRASTKDVDAVASALSEHLGTERLLLLQIARETYPDLVPNSFGDDPWWTSIQHAKGILGDLDRQYLAAYLLCRAFGYRSRNQAQLIEFGFDDVYNAAAGSKLSRDAWNLVESRLPRPWFSDWDYCQRLRDAVVDAFIERDLSTDTFTRVTRDDKVFRELVELAARSWRGRSYLRKSLQRLKDQYEWSSRAGIIEGVL